MPVRPGHILIQRLPSDGTNNLTMPDYVRLIADHRDVEAFKRAIRRMATSVTRESTNRTTRVRALPRARRMPISIRRRLTVYAVTP